MSNARDKVAELVTSAAHALTHAGVATQPELERLAGRNGVFAVLDAPNQDSARGMMTPCTATEWRDRWEVVVRIDAAHLRAEESVHRQAGQWMRAIIARLELRHLFAGDVDHIHVDARWSQPEPIAGTDGNPVAWLVRLPILVTHYS